MAIRIFIETPRENAVHFRGAHARDYTLCGLDAVGDEEEGISEPVITDKPVDCADCIAIVKYCKSIKAKEIK